MMSFRDMKLGKKAAVFHPKTPQLAAHKLASAPPPPSADWTHKVKRWGLWRNDELGDCTAVGVGNAFAGWSYYAMPEPLNISTYDVVKFYEKTTGYNPAIPGSDQGGVELDVLTYLAQHGFATDSRPHQPETCAFAQLDAKNAIELKNSIAHLGVAYLGLALPLAAQTQDVWQLTTNPDNDPTPGSWGGHCVVAKGYDAHYVKVITWGHVKLATWDWLATYMDEAYALLSRDWLDAQGTSPEGLDWDKLEADLQSFLGA